MNVDLHALAEDLSVAPYVAVPATGTERPILVSVPHSGTEFPPSLRSQFLPDIVKHPVDTDWLIHKLYDFAPAMGITLIHARWSRFVLDLNRSPDDTALYADGRRQTGLIPSMTFAGEPIYRHDLPAPDDIALRKKCIHQPYYDKVRDLLASLKRRHKNVLFYDAHSITRHAPAVQADPLPDLMLGDNDGKAAHPSLIKVAIDVLSAHNKYSVTYNRPFKGGHLTRHFGQPNAGIHALQLERSQDTYLNAEGDRLSEEKATTMRAVLESMFQQLTETLRGLP